MGACKDVGYTSFDHNMTVEVGYFGKYNVTVFNKTSESLESSESVKNETEKSLESVEIELLAKDKFSKDCVKVYILDNYGQCG